MNERIEKKLQQIAKIEKRIAKWESAKTEEKFWKEEGYWFDSWARNWKEYDGSVKTKEDFFSERYAKYVKNCDEEIRRAKNDLDSAKAQLEKIKKQEEKKADKENTLKDMPEALKVFAEEIVNAWNEYDKGYRAFLREKYNEMNAKYPKNSLKGYREFIEKYHYAGYQTMHMSDQEIEENNKKDMERLIINLINRVVEKAGKITDASGLKVTSGNQGYAVINGIVYGEKGKAIVESIGAGGYNIQRYHIRTLVK